MKKINSLIALVSTLGILTGFIGSQYIQTKNQVLNAKFTSIIDSKKIAHIQCPSTSNGSELCAHSHVPTPTPTPAQTADPTPTPTPAPAPAPDPTPDSTPEPTPEPDDENNEENKEENIQRNLELPSNTELQQEVEDNGGNPHNQSISISTDLSNKDSISENVENTINTQLEESLTKELFIEISNTNGEKVTITEKPTIIIASTLEEYTKALYYQNTSQTETLETPSTKTNPNLGALSDFVNDEDFKVFEEKTEVIIIGPFNDSDSDGITDFTETIIYKTNPFLADSDKDGINDQDEIDKGKNPLSKTDSKYQKEGITNLVNNNVSENFIIKGFSNNQNVIVQARKITKKEEEKEDQSICETSTDSEGKFVCEINDKLENGSYYLFLKDVAYENNRIARINISTSQSSTPSAEITEQYDIISTSQLEYSQKAFQEILGETLFNKYFKKILETKATYGKEKMQVLKGQGETGTIIFVTWRSLILSSTVIADASQGEYEVFLPTNLATGEHNIIVYSYNPQTEFISSFIKLVFST